MIICCTCTENVYSNDTKILQFWLLLVKIFIWRMVLLFTALPIFLAWYSHDHSAFVQVRDSCPHCLLFLWLRCCKGEAQVSCSWTSFRAAWHRTSSTLLTYMPRRLFKNKSLASCNMFFLSSVKPYSQKIYKCCCTPPVTLCKGIYS